MLSMVVGILAAGVAFGPVIGGFLIGASHQLLSVFYAAVVVLACFVVFVLTWLPESLSQEQMLVNKSKYATRPPGDTIWSIFLAPLSMFLPTRFESTPGSGGQRGKDWNLTLIVITYGIVTMILVSRSRDFDSHVRENNE
jgi:MFS family permease